MVLEYNIANMNVMIASYSLNFSYSNCPNITNVSKTVSVRQ
jgi:hypothetical protein